MDDYKNFEEVTQKGVLEIQNKPEQPGKNISEISVILLQDEELIQDLVYFVTDNANDGFYLDNLMDFSSYLRGHSFEYFPVFTQNNFPIRLIEMLKPQNSITLQNAALDVINILLANKSTNEYKKILIESDLVIALTALLKFRENDRHVVIQTLYYVLDYSDIVREYIINTLDVSDVFQDFIRYGNISNDCLKVDFLFLERLISYNIPVIVETYITQIYEILNLHGPSNSNAENLLLLLSYDTIRMSSEFQNLMRKTGFDILLHDFLNNDQVLISPKMYLNILNVFALVLEEPVNFDINLECITQHLNGSSKKHKLFALMVLGNLFESDPQTISLLNEKDFFKFLLSQLDGADVEIFGEIMVCITTAICYGSDEFRMEFVNEDNDFVQELIDYLDAYHENCMIYMLINGLICLYDLLETHNGSDYAKSYFVERNIYQLFESDLELSNEKGRNAASKLLEIFNTSNQTQCQ